MIRDAVFPFVLRACVIAGLCLAVSVPLASCAWFQDWPPGEEAKMDAPYPESVKTAAAQKPSGKRPKGVSAASSDVPRDYSSLPVKQAADQGGQDRQDLLARLDALETEMAMVRNDVKTMMPALTRLADVQKSMKTMLSGIEPAAGAAKTVHTDAVPINAKAAPPVSVSRQTPSASRPGANSRQADLPGADSAGATVRALRVGHHADKVRLVLDVSDAISYSHNLDNGGRVLTVFLDNADWTAKREEYFKASPVLHSYTVSRQGGRTVLTLRLRQGTDILWEDLLTPRDGKPHRLVIDLARAA